MIEKAFTVDKLLKGSQSAYFSGEGLCRKVLASKSQLLRVNEIHSIYRA